MKKAEVITISEFKATCLAVLERVRRTGKAVVVTRRGEPVATIDPPPLPEEPESWLGSFRSDGAIVGDILSPAGEEDDWSVFRE